MSERHRAGRSALPGDPLEPVDRLFESTPIGIVMTDGDAVIVANRAFCELVGHTEGELLDRGLEELFARSTRERAGGGAAPRLRPRRGDRGTRGAVRPDGNLIDAVVRRRVVRDELATRADRRRRGPRCP